MPTTKKTALIQGLELGQGQCGCGCSQAKSLIVSERCITEQLQLPNDKQRRGRTLSSCQFWAVLDRQYHYMYHRYMLSPAGQRLKVGHMSDANQWILPESQKARYYPKFDIQVLRGIPPSLSVRQRLQRFLADLYLLYAFCFNPATTCRWRRGSHHFGPGQIGGFGGVNSEV